MESPWAGEEILINYKAQSNPGAEAYLKARGPGPKLSAGFWGFRV